MSRTLGGLTCFLSSGEKPLPSPTWLSRPSLPVKDTQVTLGWLSSQRALVMLFYVSQDSVVVMVIGMVANAYLVLGVL